MAFTQNSLNNILPNGTVATTQSPGDNTTKVATTAFVTAAVTSAAIPTPLGVGSIILAQFFNGGGGFAAGSTTAAVNLTPVYMLASGTLVSSGDTIAGTWQALQTIGGGTTNAGLVQRVS